MSLAMSARPRGAEEIVRLPPQPAVVEAARARGVRRIVHFTTRRGVLGVLAGRAVKSRKRLSQDDYLEHVYRPNSSIRKDPAWLNYVSLSVERINAWMFESSEAWHSSEDTFWAVLAFDPAVLGHRGVVFATTNNIYPSCRRAEGRTGFEAMFAEKVIGRFGDEHTRAGLPPNWTTDRQAEVLYPGELSCEHLQWIAVRTEDDAVSVEAMLAPLGVMFAVRRAPEVFA